MDLRRLGDALELLVGTIILVAGLGLAAIAAVDERFPGVVAGFTLFVIGYKLSQFSVRHTERSPFQDVVQDIVQSARLIDFLMVVIGIGMIAAGFIQLIRSIQEPDILLALGAATTMFAGYIAGHYAVNRTLV